MSAVTLNRGGAETRSGKGEIPAPQRLGVESAALNLRWLEHGPGAAVRLPLLTLEALTLEAAGREPGGDWAEAALAAERCLVELRAQLLRRRPSPGALEDAALRACAALMARVIQGSLDLGGTATRRAR
jgi:hypothetical protein